MACLTNVLIKLVTFYLNGILELPLTSLPLLRFGCKVPAYLIAAIPLTRLKLWHVD